MLKNYSIFISLLFLFCFVDMVFAQKKVEYKDVLLNGKPAKLNLSTGEFILENGDTIYTGKKIEKTPETKPQNKPIVKITKKKEELVKQAPSSQTPQIEANDTSSSDYHIVKSGETLFSISKHYNTTLTELKKVNYLQTTLIRVGQKLRVKNLDKIEAKQNWTVSKGDTLYSIAKKNNLTVNDIKQLNNLKNNTIHVGQILKLK